MIAKHLLVLIPLALTLVGCARPETVEVRPLSVHVHNSSGHELTVSFDSQSRFVLPGQTVKFPGLHFHSPIRFSSYGGIWTYFASPSTDPVNWALDNLSYVCGKSVETSINLTFSREGKLSLEPCGQDQLPKVLTASYSTRLQMSDH